MDTGDAKSASYTRTFSATSDAPSYTNQLAMDTGDTKAASYKRTFFNPKRRAIQISVRSTPFADLRFTRSVALYIMILILDRAVPAESIKYIR